MTIIEDNGELWMSTARRVTSPNCDQRPEESAIDLLVIHAISLPPKEYGGPYVEQLFTNSLSADEHPYFEEINHLRVSSHLLIRRDGELIQFVPLNARAWHAGVSEFCGRKQCNDFSIGIELEGCDDEKFTESQYQQLAVVTETIRARWPNLQQNNIVGHSDIAPGRKTDPGPFFDWQYYRKLANIN